MNTKKLEMPLDGIIKGLPAQEEIMKSKGEIRVESGISYETPVSWLLEVTMLALPLEFMEAIKQLCGMQK